MDMNFEKLGLSKNVIEGLDKLGIKEPTEIQEKAIPVLLKGENVVAQSETGTGKTLAYLLPIIEKIDTSKKEMQCIILAPTHELASQINSTIVELINTCDLKVTVTPLIGSANVNRQIEKLKKKPHILVGSGGRVLDLIKKKKITSNTIKTLVLDESDKLFDKNNKSGTKELRNSLKEDIQIMMFSATLTEASITGAQTIMNDAEVIRVKEENTVNEDIEHGYFIAERRDKIDVIRKIVHADKIKKALVFINSGYYVDIALDKLKFHKLKAEALHGTNGKEDRKRALDNFRKGKATLLIATDIAARGLDIKGITHVINLDLPEDSKDYIHRAGRVGRAGEKGISYSLVDPKEENLIKKFERDLGIEIEKLGLYKGEIIEG
ncbi:DEAD/DEAH box helicase [Clostridium sp.]|uniref:DEAD/DEAH box helicase n=1 Tax=Clostridium sp. TaxID=1506 RepID=UPI0034644B0F